MLAHCFMSNREPIMTEITAQAVQAYIDAHYLELEALAVRAGTSPETVRSLEEAQCIPGASYVTGGEMVCTSTFGEYRLPAEPRRYYHPSVLGWVEKALVLAQSHDLAEVARQQRAAFDRDFAEALAGQAPPWARGADYAWDYILDGTWGLCLKDITVATLLKKEFARNAFREIIAPAPDHELSAAERARLEAAIADYEAVALPFAPHEAPESSRVKEIRPAVEKYRLAS